MAGNLNTAIAFFEQYVEPSYLESKENPENLRLAMNLASALNNIAEYYWHDVKQNNPGKAFNQSSPGKFREELSKKLPSYGLIRDVADSHKHLFLDRKNAAISNSKQVGQKNIGYGQAYGICYGGGETVQIDLNDGSKEYFSIPAMEVYEYWKKELFT